MRYIGPELKKELKFDKNGLIPAVIQDAKNNEVLMVAYMNMESLEKSLKTGYTHFYSRSRKKLWLKGETSGHFQRIKEIRLDCDGDTLLIKVSQKVGACHKGYRSCFFRIYDPARKSLDITFTRGNIRV